MGLMSIAGRTARKYKVLRKLYRAERGFRGRVGWSSRIGYLKDGFLTDSALRYGLADRSIDRSEYITDWQREMYTPSIDSAYEFVLENKLAFDRFVRPIAPNLLPRLFGILEVGGKILPEFGVGPDTRPADAAEWVCGLTVTEGGVVVKPIDGGRGDGVMMLRYRNGAMTINGDPCSTDDVRRALSSSWGQLIVSEMLRQHPYSAAIAPNSINTIRVLSMIDPATGQPFIARSFHRFGTSVSGGIDNLGAGGISAAVDLGSGTMGRGASLLANGPEWHDNHPDTGVAITGTVIPYWDHTVATMVHLHSSMSYIPYIGWDVVISPTGPMLIEGNHYSGVSGYQVHEPLLRDQRIREFYRYHGVI